MGKAILFAAIFFGLASIGLMVSTIVLSQKDTEATEAALEPSAGSGSSVGLEPSAGSGSNVGPEKECQGVAAAYASSFPNHECNVTTGGTTPPQAGSNVTKGYKGTYGENGQTKYDPITDPYYVHGLCPVNVHWHLGTEHISQNEYDEDNGKGPTEVEHRRKLAGKARKGGQCLSYDKNEAMYTKEYEWKHCTDMEVGQTYEVHWPHSVFGACNTENQYQEPFYDGVFCRHPEMTATGYDGPAKSLLSTELPQMIGVQAQVFVVVNDESYYYPNLIDGMIVGGGSGTDMAYYTGSTTGTSRNNTVCSKYGPITWQVDRKCNKISASTFDKMCADMKSKKDDMSKDLYPHGSRVVVSDELSTSGSYGN